MAIQKKIIAHLPQTQMLTNNNFTMISKLTTEHILTCRYAVSQFTHCGLDMHYIFFILFSIGSDNSLIPEYTKPLPEPKLPFINSTPRKRYQCIFSGNATFSAGNVSTHYGLVKLNYISINIGSAIGSVSSGTKP